jgi:uncharacterized protein (TIGR03067 family)
MRRAVLPLLAVSLMAFAPAPFRRAKGKSDLEKMEGRWVLAECWSAGRRVVREEGMPVTIEGGLLTARAKDTGRVRFSWALRQGPSRNGIGHLDAKETRTFSMPPAVYRLERDTITIGYNTGSDRPSGVEGSEVRLVLTRQAY